MANQKCNRVWSGGWRCYLARNHDGPCPLWPSLWQRILHPELRGMVRR